MNAGFAHKLALDLNALAWAFAFVGRLALIEDAGVLSYLRGIGQEIDRRIEASSAMERIMACGSAPVLTGQYDGYDEAREQRFASAAEHGGSVEVPKLIMDRRGAAVVLKPVGWEVDSTGGGESCPLLSSFLQSHFPSTEFPLVHLLDFGYGFLHRLDVPSSGLILAATTFEGLYSLRWQLNTYQLSRQYITVCHGRGCPFTTVEARIDASSTRMLRSAVGDEGRPAQTFFSSLSHLGLTAQGFSIVAVNIRTGRRHQIRAHTRHVGHPTVSDAWYCPESCIVGTSD